MKAYNEIETRFEKMANTGSRWLGSPVVFLAALALTITWFAVRDWDNPVITDLIHDVVIGISFLTLFIIQRTAIHFSQALHLKLNELVAAQDNASNHIIKAEEKTTLEMEELAKEHDRIAAQQESKE